MPAQVTAYNVNRYRSVTYDWHPETVIAVLRARADGATYGQIAKTYGVPVSTARGWVSGDRRVGYHSEPEPHTVTFTVTVDAHTRQHAQAAAAGQIRAGRWDKVTIRHDPRERVETATETATRAAPEEDGST